MKEQTFETPFGMIRYWHSEIRPDRRSLVFLPGLTADHHLFDKQFDAFGDEYNILSWDAPGHAASRPFRLEFSLTDKAVWLYEILKKEGIRRPVLIGQSMGGYVSQCFMEKYPGEASGFVSIDSAPLKREYVTGAEIWALRRTEPIYRAFPWKTLRSLGINGCSTTEYGRKLMKEIMMVYDGDKERYARISGHGFRMLAEAMEKDLPYAIFCPALLICGEKDKAGSCIRYNKAWHKNTGIPLEWVKDAGHNSNTDKPEIVNALIENLVKQVERTLPQ